MTLPTNGTYTSALAATKAAPTSQTVRGKIYEALALKQMSAEQVAESLNLRINSVTARIKELRDTGKVETKGFTKGTSGTMVRLYGIVD